MSWKPTSRNTFDVKAFQAAHPELDLAPYYKATTARRFNFTAVKKAAE